MKTIIQNKLREIEFAHDIKILYSCESGSRAWGFPSPDSDYDVRFIYARPFDNYISLQPHKDHLSFPINDELDIYGWDISKVLRLIGKSNTTPFEWLQSPVIYRENSDFVKSLWQLCKSYFCARGNIHHYLGIAYGAMETMQGDEIKIKKLFYVLRPLLAAMWSAKHNEIAPMNIKPLMTLLTTDLQTKINKLIEFKATAYEGHLIKIDDDIKTWIDYAFAYSKEVASTFDKINFDLTEADSYFKKMILQ